MAGNLVAFLDYCFYCQFNHNHKQVGSQDGGGKGCVDNDCVMASGVDCDDYHKANQATNHITPPLFSGLTNITI